MHTVTAAYAGDVNYASSTSDVLSLLVGQSGSSTAVSNSVNPSVSGQGVTFTATVSATGDGVGTPTGTVQFFVDGVVSGSPVAWSSGVATSASISTLTVDAHSIDAHYSGDVDFSLSQGNVIQNVGKGSSATAVTTDPTSSLFGQPVTLTATVTASGAAAGVPSGRSSSSTVPLRSVPDR